MVNDNERETAENKQNMANEERRRVKWSLERIACENQCIVEATR